MSQVLGVAIMEGELRPVPKHGLNFEEVAFALGAKNLATELRQIGALVPVKRFGRVLLFDAGHVAEVWARYTRGEYDSRLKRKGVFAEE